MKLALQLEASFAQQLEATPSFQAVGHAATL